MTPDLQSQKVIVREAYLAEVTNRLRLIMTPVEEHEMIAEMRAHIDAMSDAYEELGMEQTEAMRLAVARFGSAKASHLTCLAKSGSPVVEILFSNSFRPPSFSA